MERRLVTVRKIKEIEEHPNADRLEIAVIDGWRCIVKKDEFKKDDSGLFFEIDSFLPIREEFEFLRSGSTFKRMTVDGKEITGFRLRTMKLRGVLSQGLLVPLSMFPEIDFSEDKDYSDDLGVLKFEPPIPAQLSGQIEGMFPSYIKKTDQERCLCGDTLICTDNGIKTIKEIVDSNIKCMVKSYNIESGTIEFKKVIGYINKRNNNDWYKIELENGVNIICTSDHRIFVPSISGYRQVKDLCPEDMLLYDEN